MKITTEPTGERQLALTIEVDEERVRQAKRRAAREISREVQVPGFRKGKAPYEVLVQRLGEDVVRDELVGMVAEDAYREALEQEDIAAYAPGSLHEVAFDPLVLQFVIPLTPEVDLGDYREYRRDFAGAEITEEEIDRALEEIREQNAILDPVDRPAAEGDLLVGQLTGRASDGSVFLEEEEARVRLEGDDAAIPGLVDELIGLEAGEERSFTLVLPEDFPVEALRGDEAEFSVSVETVYERFLPNLDDDLARTVGNYESLRELRDQVRGRLREGKEAQADSEYAELVLQEIIDQAEVVYPPEMVEERLDDAVESYEVQVERRERMMLKDYLRIQGKTMEELREELRPEVVDTLKRALVLGEIVAQEKLEVSDVELDIQIAESSEQYGEQADAVREALSAPEGRRDLHNRMLATKAIERLVAIARGDAPDLAVEASVSTKTEEAEELEDEGSTQICGVRSDTVALHKDL